MHRAVYLAEGASHHSIAMFAPNCIDCALVFHACALSGIVVSPVAPNFQTAELKQQLQVVITANVHLLHLRMLLLNPPSLPSFCLAVQRCQVPLDGVRLAANRM